MVSFFQHPAQDQLNFSASRHSGFSLSYSYEISTFTLMILAISTFSTVYSRIRNIRYVPTGDSMLDLTWMQSISDSWDPNNYSVQLKED